MSDATAEQKASLTDWLAVAAAILGAFTAILDIQITNSSLSDIQGALGASPEEGSWISTAYLMAEIIVIPLTGWLGSIFGLRRYLAVNTALFIGFSIACALSTSLTEMIFFRAGQGFTGGVLIPTAITIVRTRLPKSQQGVGIALFGLTATFAPAIGPTIGGWLTDNLSWHYIFYLNLVPGPLALALQLYALPKAPMKLAELPKGDWIGIGLMALGLPALTFILEEGQRKDWFGSPVIVQAAWLAAIGIVGFIVRELMAAKPFINLRVLGNRSVGGGCLLMTVLGAVSFGSIYVIPVYCAQIQGYNAEQIGYVVMWSGLPQLVLFPAMPFFMKRFDPRMLIVTGTLLFAASCFINVGPHPRRRHGPAHSAAAPARRRPAAVHGAAQPDLDRRPRAARHRRRLRALQHDAQSRRIDRHRHALDHDRAARAFPFLGARRGDDAERDAHPAAARRDGRRDAGACDRPDRGASAGAQPHRRARSAARPM